MQIGNALAASVTPTSYRIWQNCYRISNGLVDAVIVPAIGRIMHFGHAGGSNLLWECDLDPAGHAVDVEGWANFGGDKTWPAPDSSWNGVTGRPWPPPAAFDGFPHDAHVDGNTVILTSPLDPHFGLQTMRRISLVAGQPAMRISTEFRKITGPEVQTSVWTITQLRHPESVFALLSEKQGAHDPYVLLMPIPPKGITVDGRLVSLERDAVEKTKVGFDAPGLLWIGERETLRIDAPTVPGAFPDRGSRTEIYTNSDPLPYVELETLGPLVTLKAGDRAEWTTTYTLGKRQCPTIVEEARRVFSVL